MNMMPKEEVNAKEAMKQMPPLIKGIFGLAPMWAMEQLWTSNSARPMSSSFCQSKPSTLRYFSDFGAPDEILAATCFKARPFGPLGGARPGGTRAGKGRR